MKKLIALLLAVLMVVCLFAGCASKAPADEPVKDEPTKEEPKDEPAKKEPANPLEGITVGFSQNSNVSTWRVAQTADIEAKAAELGVTLLMTDAGGDIAKQASDIDDLVSRGVDYLIVCPQNEDGLQTALMSAMDAGIPVILADRTVKGEQGVCYTTQVMSDFIWEAEQVAGVIIDHLGGKGNVVIIQGKQGASSTIDRQAGFLAAIEGTEIKVIADQVGNYSMDEAQEVMENILQAHGGNIDAVYCHNDDMVQGAIKALEAAGYEPGVDVVLGGIDGSKATMEAIMSGKQLVSCSCSPFFGEKLFELITMMANGEEVEPNYVNVDTLYTIENATLEAGY